MAENATNAENGAENNAAAENNTNQQSSGAQNNNNSAASENLGDLSTEALDRIIQARVDKITAELGKKNANLQKELDKAKKQNMTNEEIKNLELADKQKELDERASKLLEGEHRLYAIKAIKTAGLDDGSEKALELVDVLISGAKDESEIDKRVQSFNDLIKKFVSDKVDSVFKANGRVPNGSSDGGNAENGKNTTIAEKIGKEKAARDKSTADILSKYIRR